MDTESIVAILARNSLLGRMPRARLDILANHCMDQSFTAGETIFAKGDDAQYAYVLVDGEVVHPEVGTEQADYSVLSTVNDSGGLFGFAAIVENSAKRIVSARANRATRLLAIEGIALRASLNEWGREGHEFTQELSRRYAAHELWVQGREGWISIRNASKVYDPAGKNVVAVDNCSIEIRPGEFCAIVGPSGCGKSTLLNAIAGFDNLTEGSVLLDGRAINQPGRKPIPGPERIVVFQNGALFPWATIRENLIRGPVVQGRLSKAEALEKARALLAKVGLSGIEDLYPGSISSGMSRRVEIIRGILNEPKVLLLDEPFRGLDALTKTVTQTALLELYDLTKKTVLFITHDLEEAIYLADRVLVMTSRPGHIKQTIAVNLERPRDERILTTPDFIKLKNMAIEAVHEEAVKAFNAGEKEHA